MRNVFVSGMELSYCPPVIHTISSVKSVFIGTLLSCKIPSSVLKYCGETLWLNLSNQSVIKVTCDTLSLQGNLKVRAEGST